MGNCRADFTDSIRIKDRGVGIGIRYLSEQFVLQSPILGTHFITPPGRTVPLRLLRAPALRVVKNDSTGRFPKFKP